MHDRQKFGVFVTEIPMDGLKVTDKVKRLINPGLKGRWSKAQGEAEVAERRAERNPGNAPIKISAA
jgi:hypothetical protein